MPLSLETSILELTGTSYDSFCVEDNEEYLNALGTRPPLPDTFVMTDDFMPVLALFHCCTDEEPCNRPSASAIVDSLEPILKQNGIDT